ncbi:MAG: hypothetical protein WC124_01995 [Desulfoplanes sp.]
MKKALIIAPQFEPPNYLPPHDNNVSLWQATLAARGFTSIVAASTPAETTLASVRAVLRAFMQGLVKGDRWAIIRVSHGHRLIDQNGDELDGYDECFACSDLGLLVDDEMATYLAIPPPGTVGDLVDDFCYSGTANQVAPLAAAVPRIGVGSGTRPAYYRYWQACQAYETSSWGYSDGQPYSIFSLYLCWALRNYTFNPAIVVFNAAKNATMSVASQTPILSGPYQNAVPF